MKEENYQHSDPIDFVIQFAWASGCDRFVINNAKDELEKLKEIRDKWEKHISHAE